LDTVVALFQPALSTTFDSEGRKLCVLLEVPISSKIIFFGISVLQSDKTDWFLFFAFLDWLAMWIASTLFVRSHLMELLSPGSHRRCYRFFYFPVSIFFTCAVAVYCALALASQFKSAADSWLAPIGIIFFICWTIKSIWLCREISRAQRVVSSVMDEDLLGQAENSLTSEMRRSIRKLVKVCSLFLLFVVK